LEEAEIERDFFQSEVKLRNRIPATSDPVADVLRNKEKTEAQLARALKLIGLAVELARWDLNPKLRDDLIDFITQIQITNTPDNRKGEVNL
jgi:hypothetical protein